MREDTVELRLYNRLLVRLLAILVAALAVLAIILGYGLPEQGFMQATDSYSTNNHASTKPNAVQEAEPSE
jgi:hypothetical protein